jgi:hypothetical protein
MIHDLIFIYFFNGLLTINSGEQPDERSIQNNTYL